MKLQFIVLLQVVTFTYLCSDFSTAAITKEKAAEAQREAQARVQEEERIKRENAPKVFTTNGVQCVFPFKFGGELYFGCTSANTLLGARVQWCQTVYEIPKGQPRLPGEAWYYDPQDRYWGYCEDSKNLTAPMTTFDNAPCHFPFVYKNVRYYGCTTVDHPRHKSWCMVLDPETQILLSKDLCRDSRNAEIDTYGGTGRGLPCKFPFTYDGQARVHWGCSNDQDSRGQYRCPTEDGWGYCNIIDTETNLKRLRSTIGDIFKESDCVFPFIYGKQEQFGCIGSSPWCATTNDYDRDGKYRYCDERDILGVASRKRDAASGEFFSCTFPYLLNGTLYSELVPNPTGGSGKHNDMYICPTMYNIRHYEETTPTLEEWKFDNYRYKYEWVSAQQSWGVSQKCPQPWYFGNVQQHGCNAGSYHYWCSTTTTFDADNSDWYNCATLDEILYPSKN